MASSSKTSWLLLVALLAGGGYYYRTTQEKAEADKAPRFSTVAIDRGPISAKVSASGTLSALVTVQVGSQVSGRLKEIFVDWNSEVKKGQVIAKLDPQLFSAALEQARANSTAAAGELERAQIEADEAARQLARTRSLSERKLIAQADLDAAESAAASARAATIAARGRVEQAKASLNQAKINLQYATITSPIDGIVISRSVDVGQTVAASLQAPTLFAIAEDLRKMQVNTSVAESDIGKLRAGMDAEFTVDAFPGERFVGRVRQIRNSPQTVQNVVTYDAVIDVDNDDLELRPGMTANVSFIYADRDDVTRIPNAALRFRPSAALLEKTAGPKPSASPSEEKPQVTRRGGGGAGTRTVWKLEGQTPKAVEIKTGVTDGTHTELIEGALTTGDTLITEAPGDDTGKPAMPMRRVL